MRSGFLSTEFWLGLAVTIGIVVQKSIWPEHPFPAEALTVFGLWVAGRIGEKTLGKGDPDKRAYRTSEFWITLGFGIVKYIFPELPAGIENFVYVYILGRPAVKVMKNSNLVSLLTGKKG